MKEQPWYFTFGMGMRNKNGESLGKSFVRIDGEFNHARSVMFEKRKDSWAFQYNEDQFKGQPEKFGLREISLEDCE